MKRIEFTITGDNGQVLREPVFVEDCSELPIALMRAMEDYLQAHEEEEARLPITIRVQPSSLAETC